MSILSSSNYDNFRFLNSRFPNSTVSKVICFQNHVFLNLQYSKVSRDATILKLPLATTAQGG